MNDRPNILTIEISKNGDTTAKLDYGRLTGGRQDIAYEIDWNIIRQLIRKQFAAIRRDNIGEVRKAGDDLMQHLLPKEIRTIFPRDGEALLLSTNRHAIPWELLFDGDFLGVRFAIGRQLITRDKIRKPGVHLKAIRQFVTADEIRKPEGETHQKTCLFLTNPTEDLPEARREAKRLMEYFRNHDIACTLIAGEQITSADIYSYLRSKFDIVHYSGHIDIDEKREAYLRLSKKDRFYLRTALTLDDFGRPFIFLNGCGVGPARGGSAKIVRPLIDAGCGPILCATMPITDRGSRLFSEQLIENVLQGMSYGKATMEARRRFCSDPSGGTDWMCFAYYGNPLECIEASASVVRQSGDQSKEPNDVQEISNRADPENAVVINTAEHKKNPKAVHDEDEDEERRRQERKISAGRSDVETDEKLKALPGKKILFFLLAILSTLTALFFLLTPGARKSPDSAEIPAPQSQTPPALNPPAPQIYSEPIPDAPLTLEDALAVTGKADDAPSPPPAPAALSVKPKANIAPPPAAAANAADFYGSWKNGAGVVMEISRNEMTRSLDDVTFRMNITGVEPISNSSAETRADYPSGIRFTGLVTEKGWWIDSPEIGMTHSYTFFMHTDRKSFSQSGLADSGSLYTR